MAMHSDWKIAKLLARQIVRSCGPIPEIALITGTGLSSLVQSMQVRHSIPYHALDGFVQPTVRGHRQLMLLGNWSKRPVVALTGRFHYYEGYSIEQIVFPIRVLYYMGIRHIYMTNVAGGINPSYRAGDIIFLSDHIYLMANNPLIGVRDDSLGRADSKAYDPTTAKLGIAYCQKNKIAHGTGIYACLAGPSLETPAEYKYLHTLGADLVGMSTIPEVLAARQMGIKVTALSVVSNVCHPFDQIRKTTIEEVVAVANDAIPRLSQVLKYLIGE